MSSIKNFLIFSFFMCFVLSFKGEAEATCHSEIQKHTKCIQECKKEHTYADHFGDKWRNCAVDTCGVPAKCKDELSI